MSPEHINYFFLLLNSFIICDVNMTNDVFEDIGIRINVTRDINFADYGPPLTKEDFDNANLLASSERSVLAKSFQEYEKSTCVMFVPRKNEDDYIHISKKTGCWSVIGRDGGQQDLSIDIGCFHVGIIIHELMHSIGFFHEQSRPDRDDHVTIVWENIVAGMESDFAKREWEEVAMLYHYDIDSVMHYDSYDFSKGAGLATVLDKRTGEPIEGSHNKFTATDLCKINKYYDCPNHPECLRLKPE